jgi:cephalosporin hydroxylase
MKIVIDTDAKTLTCAQAGKNATYPLYSKESFKLISGEWLKVGWNEKYVYTFTWLGRPIIQLPEDILRVQEVIYRVKPDVIIETGIAHGGSLILYASLCKAMGKGRVVGVDIEIRPHNRKAIQEHELAGYITMIEGSSTDSAISDQVRALVKPTDVVLVLLDSNHTREHVLQELETYYGLVTPGSYIVATDGSMKDLSDVPRGKPEWSHDNPFEAAKDFVKARPEFTIEQPRWGFNESKLAENITHWPGAWLRRK